LTHEVRLAIEAGIPPIRAYQMATINNARHWRLDRDHGGIAPGRYADILVVSDLEKVTIDRVFANGREVARNGRLIIPLEGLGNPNRLAPGYALNTVRLAREVTADDFRVSGSKRARCLRPTKADSGVL
jgi:adenine deaminase